MPSPLEGIREKLKRADQNIVSLQSEIAVFFEEGKRPSVGERSIELIFKEALDHGHRKVPVRISVLTGEIIHHLRSALDHIMWKLATRQARIKHPTKIEFPICDDITDRNKASSYNGKIQLLASNEARRIIDELQPYHRRARGEDPERDTLFILHDLDRIYKHRELRMTFVGYTLGSPTLDALAMRYASDPTLPFTGDIARQFEQEMDLAAIIVIDKFCKGEGHSVIPALLQLQTCVRDIFEELIVEILKLS